MHKPTFTVSRSPNSPTETAITATDGNSPSVEEHGSQDEATVSNPPCGFDEAHDWYRQYLDRDRELAVEREKISQLQAANLEAQKEILKWREKCSQAKNRLQDERREHGLTKTALEQRQHDASHWYSLLQEANREIGSAKNNRQAHHQLDDTEIAMRTMRLRVDIRDFALRYVETDLGELRIPSTSYSLINKYLQSSSRAVDTYIQCPSTRPDVIRAFLWAFLDEKVFRRFLWAPRPIGEAMESIHDFIENKTSSDADTEVERKVNMWRANTTNLLLETMDQRNEAVQDNLRSFVSRKASILADCIGPIALCKSGDLISPLSTLLNKSLTLDQELSQQVARWSWYFPRRTPCGFDPETMDMISHKKQTEQSQVAQLILSPALVKRGNSSGEDFDVEEVHVKMEVECEPLPRTTTGNGFSLLRALHHTTHDLKDSFKQRALDKKGHN